MLEMWEICAFYRKLESEDAVKCDLVVWEKFIDSFQGLHFRLTFL